MFSIYLQSVKNHYRSAIYVGLGLSLMSMMFAMLFDEMKDQLAQFTDVIPGGFEALIGDLAVATKPEGWLSVELFALFVPISMAILGIVYGSGLIGREEESGTLELLLASPQTRTQIVLQKLLALTDLLAIPMLVLFSAITLWGVVFDFRPDLLQVFAACASAWLLGLAYGSVAFAVQSVTGRRGLAVGIGTAVFAATYMLTILSKLLESWKDYGVYSPFYYYNNPEVLLNGIEWEKALVLVVIFAVLSVAAIVGFQRRDTGV